MAVTWPLRRWTTASACGWCMLGRCGRDPDSWTGNVWLALGRSRHGREALLLVGLRDQRHRVRQVRDGEVGVSEVEGGRQVTGDRPPPVRDVGGLHPGPGLQELEHRGVVVGVGIHVAAAGPRRGDDHRHPVAEADRQPVDELVRHARVGRRGQHVVKVAVVLVIGDEQGGAVPQLLVAHQRLEHRPDVVRAVARARRRVLGVVVRRHDPGDLRQGARGGVGDELGQHVVDVVRAERHAGAGLPGLDGAADGQFLPGRGGRVLRVLVLLVEPQRVVAEVTDPGVVAAAVPDLVVGVDLPA